MKFLKNKIMLLASVTFILLSQSCSTKQTEERTLKTAFADKFTIGAALNSWQIDGRDSAAIKIVKEHFNSIVAENIMKSENIQPKEGKFDFSKADKFIEFGVENNLEIIGHTLIWHSQTPKWFFIDSEGNEVSKEVLIERMKNHIQTVVGRYKGKVKGWDVVNEAILDNGDWRQSKFYKIIGEEFMELAFRFAHEADPDAELYYNDYSMSLEGKRNGVVKMVKKLQDKGVRIDAIGMQSHVSINHPSIDEYEKSLLAFANLNVKVMMTELDISVLPSPWENLGADISTNFELKKELNPYEENLPDSINEAFNQRYLEFFKLFLKYNNKIKRVTLWGVHDGQSWKNNWPIRGRKDYPLLFDRHYTAKPVVDQLITEASSYDL